MTARILSLMRNALAARYRRAKWLGRRARAGLRAGWPRLSAMPVVFGNAIPKSGSTLFFNILRGMPEIGPFVVSGLPVIKPFTDGKPTSPTRISRQLRSLRGGDIACGYLYATPENMAEVLRPNWANFLILRDPRDTIVSAVHYAMDLYPGHALHDYLRRLPSLGERIEVFIYGIAEGALQRVGVRQHYERFLPWTGSSQVCVVRFEDLLSDPAGQLGRMLDWLQSLGFVPELPKPQAIAALAAQMDPAQSATFREGRAGGWREQFTEANKRHFKEAAGALLVDLGYEVDLDW